MTAPATMPVPGGAHLDPAETAKLPVVLLLLWDVDDDEVAGIVDDVARLQVATTAFRPLFVTRGDDYAPFRRHGYLFEYVMPYADWLKVAEPAGWAEFVAGRLDSIVAAYRPVQILTVPTSAQARRDDLLAALLPLLGVRR